MDNCTFCSIITAIGNINSENNAANFVLDLGSRASKILSPYSTGNGVCIGYPTRMKSTHKKRNVHGQRQNFALGPNATYNYSTGLRLGFASGKTQILGYASDKNANYGVRVGCKIPTCWYSQRKILALGALPNTNPRRQVFCVAVEYRL